MQQQKWKGEGKGGCLLVCLYLCFSVKQKLASLLNPATQNFHRHMYCTQPDWVLNERGKKLLICNEQQIQTHKCSQQQQIHIKPQSNVGRLFMLHMPMIQNSHWCQLYKWQCFRNFRFFCFNSNGNRNEERHGQGRVKETDAKWKDDA